MDEIICIANLFDLVLNDPVRYHIAQAAVNTSLKPNFIKKIYDLSKANTFKDLLQEAKHASKSVNLTIQEVFAWKDYKFDQEEYEVPTNNNNRYSYPYGEDEFDDSDKDASLPKVIAAKGIYLVNVGSFVIKANYPSQFMISVNERFTELCFHFFNFVPKVYNKDKSGEQSGQNFIMQGKVS